MNTGNKRAAIYRRVSTEEQQDNYSLGSQEKECRALCERLGYTVVADEADVHTGAKLNRRGLTAIRALIRAGEADVLVLWKLDRLSRRMWHGPELLSECEENRVTVVSVVEEIDTSTPIGKFMVMGILFVAEQERENFRLRSERNRRARVESGKPLAGVRPTYGYRWRLSAPNTTGKQTKIGLDPDPATAPIVQRIFRELAEGKSRRAVCAGLDADGIPTPKGGALWDKSTLTHMVKNPVYWGEGYAFRHKREEVTRVDKKTGQKRTVYAVSLMQEGIPYSHETVPPLVSPEIGRAVQERLARGNSAAPRGNKHPEAYLLRGGFIRCGHCGHAMICRTSRHRNGEPRLQYICATNHTKPGACLHNAIETHLIDRPVWEFVTNILSQPGIIENELQRLSSETSDPTTEVRASVSARLADIDRQRAKVAHAIAILEDEEASAPLLLQLKTLAKLASEGQAELVSLEEQRTGWQAAQVSMQQLAAWCSEIAPRVERLTHAEKQQLLHVLGLTVSVWKPGHAPDGIERYCIDVLPFAKEVPTGENLVRLSLVVPSLSPLAGVTLRWNAGALAILPAPVAPVAALAR